MLSADRDDRLFFKRLKWADLWPVAHQHEEGMDLIASHLNHMVLTLRNDPQSGAAAVGMGRSSNGWLKLKF